MTCFPPILLTSLRGKTQELDPQVLRFLERHQTVLRKWLLGGTACVYGGGEDHRNKGPSKAQDSWNSQPGAHHHGGGSPLPYIQLCTIPSSSSSHTPTSTYYTQSISHQLPASLLTELGGKKKSRFRKTHPRILLTEHEAIPHGVALSLLYN